MNSIHQEPPSFPWPYPLAVAPQLLHGRTRSCAFWVSPMALEGMRYIVDTSQLDADWPHNPARDEVPPDTLLVVVSPRDAERIRKEIEAGVAKIPFNAFASLVMEPSPALLAARIIDSQCRAEPGLAVRLRWKL